MIDINVNNIFFKSFSVDPNSGHSIYVFDSTYLPDPEILGNDKQVYDLLINELMDRLVEKLPSSPYSLVVFSSGFSQMKISWIYGIKMFSKIPKELKYYLQKTYIVHESFFIRTVYQVLSNAMNIKFLTTSKKFATKTYHASNKANENTTLQEDSMGNFSMIHVPNLTILSKMIDITRLRISLNVYLHDYSINEYIDVPEEYFQRLSNNSKRKYRQLVFDKIFKKLAMYGPETELIFQRPGTHRRVNIFLDIIERNNYIDLSQWDLYSLASVFLNFLKNKAKPLIPVDLIVLPIQDEIEYTVAIFHKIVEYNGYFDLIIAIFPLFLSILQASEITRHTSRSLSKAIAPTLCKEKISINNNDRLRVGTRYIKNLLENFNVIINTYEHNKRAGRSVSQPSPETLPTVYRTSRSPIRVHSHSNTALPAIPRPRKSNSGKYPLELSYTNSAESRKELKNVNDVPEISNKNSITDFRFDTSNKELSDISRKNSSVRSDISVATDTPALRNNSKESIHHDDNSNISISRSSSRSHSKENVAVDGNLLLSRSDNFGASRDIHSIREMSNISRKSSFSSFRENNLGDDASTLSRQNSMTNLKETSPTKFTPDLSNRSIRENSPIKHIPELVSSRVLKGSRETSPDRKQINLSRKSSIQHLRETSPSKTTLPNDLTISIDKKSSSPLKHDDNIPSSPVKYTDDLDIPSSPSKVDMLVNNFSSLGGDFTMNIKPPAIGLQSKKSMPDLKNKTSIPNLQNKSSIPNLRNKVSVPNLRRKTSIPNLRSKPSIANISQGIGSTDSVEQRQTSTSSTSSVVINKVDINKEWSSTSASSIDSSSNNYFESDSINDSNDFSNATSILPLDNTKSNVENIKSTLTNSAKSSIDDMVTDSLSRPLELNRFQMFDRELKQQKQKKLKELSTKDTLFAKDFSKINTSNRNVSKVSKLAALYEERLQGLEVMNEILKNNK